MACFGLLASDIFCHVATVIFNSCSLSVKVKSALWKKPIIVRIHRLSCLTLVGDRFVLPFI